MNNTNKLIYFLAFVLALILGLIFFYIKSDKPNVELLTINVYSDHPLKTDSDGMMSDDVDVFCDVYESEGSAKFISKVFFKRLDDGSNKTDLIKFSEAVSDDMDPSKAKLMFEDERATLDPTPLMGLEFGNESESLKLLTKDIRHYYLLSEGSTKIDDITYFDNVADIKAHIENGLSNGTLFEDLKVNLVHIFILSGESATLTDGGAKTDPRDDKVNKPSKGTSVSEDEVEGPPPPIEVDESPVEPPPLPATGPITIVYNLKRVDAENSNTISWSSDIPDYASSVKIRYVFKFDEKQIIKEYDVSGSNTHTLNMQNAKYSAIPTDVSLIVTPLSKNVKLSGSNKLSNELFNCSGF